MSGFPGPHSYSEFARRQPERDREESRQDVSPVDRSAELHDLLDVIDMRIRMLAFVKADKITDRDLHHIARTLVCALEHFKELNEQITKLRQSARKEGSDEGK